MRFYFLILISMVLVSVLTIVTVNSITGKIAVIPDCPRGCTYFPLETTTELARLENRLGDNFYIYGIYQATGFNSGGEYVACACPTK
jgi:hypothetical protein